jgi:hypothetical protein
MPGELRVDTAPLATGGQGLLSAAGDIPLPPIPFTAVGGDALSTILNARTQAIEAPFIAGMPVTKAEALRIAQNIIQAAAKYEGVDQNLADQVLKALSELAGAEASGAGGTGAAGGAATAATAGATPAAGAAQQAGQLGQMMGMPMQMAQQAAQIPMQLAGMVASIPQGIMQGVQSAMQQVGQMAGGAGEETDPELDRQGDSSDEAKHAESANEVPAEKPSTPSDGAAGPSNAERALATGPQPAPDIPQQPHKAAPTRPATSGPESVL